MPDIHRSFAELLTLHPDNDEALIEPQDSREAIIAARGYLAFGAPTADHDNVDTAGVGHFFGLGSRWIDQATGDVWFCYGIAPGAAQWSKQSRNPAADVPVGGATGQILAKASDDDHETEWIDPPEGTLTDYIRHEGGILSLVDADTFYSMGGVVRDIGTYLVCAHAIVEGPDDTTFECTGRLVAGEDVQAQVQVTGVAKGVSEPTCVYVSLTWIVFVEEDDTTIELQIACSVDDCTSTIIPPNNGGGGTWGTAIGIIKIA